MRSLAFMTCGVALLGACAQIATDPLPGQTVKESWSIDGITWQSGGGIYVSLTAFEKDNRVAVCGLRAEQANKGDPSHDLNPVAIQAMRVELASDTVFSDVAAFPTTNWTGRRPLGEAKCFLTSQAWKPKYNGVKPLIETSKTNFVYYD